MLKKTDNFPDWEIKKPLIFSFDPESKILNASFQNNLKNSIYKISKIDNDFICPDKDLIFKSNILLNKYKSLRDKNKELSNLYYKLYFDLRGKIWANRFLF